MTSKPPPEAGGYPAWSYRRVRRCHHIFAASAYLAALASIFALSHWLAYVYCPCRLARECPYWPALLCVALALLSGLAYGLVAGCHSVEIVLLAVTVPFLGVVLYGFVADNLMGAADRGKQERTMTELHALGRALEAYRADAGRHPGVAAWPAMLAPTYVPDLPPVDGWRHPSP